MESEIDDGNTWSSLRASRVRKRGGNDRRSSEGQTNSTTNEELLTRSRGRSNRSRFSRGRNKATATHRQSTTDELTKLSPKSQSRGRGRGYLNKQYSTRGHVLRRGSSFTAVHKSAHIHRLEIKDLEEISNLSPSNVVYKLQDDLKGFQHSLNSCHKVSERSKHRYIKIIIVLLSKTCQAIREVPNEVMIVLAEFLSDRCADFHVQLREYIATIDKPASQTVLKELYDIFQFILNTLPSSAWSVLPIDGLHEAVIEHFRTERSFIDKVEQLKLQRDKIKVQHCKKKQCSNEIYDTSEYRQVPILPTAEELFEPPPNLRSNIINGPYRGWEHYYDIQFRLLREDFLAPLRRGVLMFSSEEKGRLTDINVYNEVKLLKPEFTESGICYEVQFDSSRFRQRRSWLHSKRLIYGSLLCFSPQHDRFNEDIYFAIVIDRKPEELDHGVFHVQFEHGLEMFRHIKKTVFTVIESKAYFEASRHILKSLQTAEVDTMPFTHYLIDNQPTPVDHPRYFKESSPFYDLCWLYPNNNPLCDEYTDDEDMPLFEYNFWSKFVSPFQQSTGHVIDITDDTAWPSANDTELDESQLKAIKMALTQEIALIQGPPGTGKTYIGYKIVQTLLQNRKVWDPKCTSPILVMCYTNHALDQFLKGIIYHKIIDMSTGERKKPIIVRIGSRSKNEQIQACSLWHARRRTVPHHLLNSVYDNKDYIVGIAKEIPWHSLQRIIQDPINEYIVGPNGMERLRSVIDPRHYYQLVQIGDDNDMKQNSLEIWLGLYERYCPSEYAENSTNDAASVPPVEESVPIYNAIFQEVTTEKDDEVEKIDVKGEAEIEESNRRLDDQCYNVIEMKQEDTGEFNDALSQHICVQKDTFGVLEDNNELSHQLLKKSKQAINKILRNIRRCEAFEIEQEKHISDVNELDMENRYKLFKLWVLKYQQRLGEITYHKVGEFENACRTYKSSQQDLDRIALEKAEVIGITTTGAAKYQHILHLVKPKIVIVEEAAEVLESHIVSALNAGTQHLILIGDHKQLRPKPNEYELAKQHNFEISLFERLLLNQVPHATLLIQHRMRPEIANLVCPFVYKKLINHSSVMHYGNVIGFEHNMYFFHHVHPEQEIEHLLSHANTYEAKFVVALCKHLLNQGYAPSQITILTAYTGQLLKLRDLMPKKDFEGVQVVNVDNFQGEENDIIILSLVRNNDVSKVGFLREENRVCVALSRAKMGLYCFGNFEMLRKVVPLWEVILAHVNQQNCLGSKFYLRCHNHLEEEVIPIKEPEEFSQYFPEGGCRKPCTYRLNCGHSCKRSCHVVDSSHEQYQCLEVCHKPCSKGLHRCTLKCWEDCGSCMIPVVYTMPLCCHKQIMECCKNPRIEKCIQPCSKVCPDGHKCPKYCWEQCGPCSVIVVKENPKCKHLQKMICHRSPSEYRCTRSCTRVYSCGHTCPKKCYEDCDSVCSELVEKAIPKCSHIDTVPCYITTDVWKCTKPCEKILKCGHKCKGKCSEQCLLYSCQELISISLPCKHKMTVKCCDKEVIFVKIILDKLEYRCLEPCTKILACGHPCKEKCSDHCTVKCSVQVNYYCSNGHESKTRCCEVQKTNFVRQCYEICSQKLECGHICKKKCHEECYCEEIVQKKCSCGHGHKWECGDTVRKCNCTNKCQQTLQCGHRCTGKCGECFTKRIHPPCVYEVQVNRFCGHYKRLPCIGFIDKCKEQCQLCVCPHRTKPCGYECFKDCTLQCNEVCMVECPHFKCPKVCSKICGGRQCNEPCSKVLEKCHHHCPGMCGERCLKLCMICNGKKFQSNVKGLGNKTSLTSLKYIELDCGHMYTIEYLNQLLFIDPKQDRLVSPLLCPTCSKPFISNYYWRICKERMEEVKLVKSQIATANEIDQSKFIALNLEIKTILEKEKISYNQPRRKKHQPADYTIFEKTSECLCAMELIYTVHTLYKALQNHMPFQQKLIEEAHNLVINTANILLTLKVSFHCSLYVT